MTIKMINETGSAVRIVEKESKAKYLETLGYKRVLEEKAQKGKSAK